MRREIKIFPAYAGPVSLAALQLNKGNCLQTSEYSHND